VGALVGEFVGAGGLGDDVGRLGEDVGRLGEDVGAIGDGVGGPLSSPWKVTATFMFPIPQ